MKVLELNLSNVCNGYCEYCPYKQPKKQKFMSRHTVDKIAESADIFDEIHLAGFSEPTLHPDILYIVEKLSHLSKVEVNTNCIEYEIILEIAKYNVFFTMHRLKGEDKEYYRKFDLLLSALESRVFEEDLKEEDKLSRCGKLFMAVLPRRVKDCRDETGHNYIIDRVMIDYNGESVLCCNDWNISVYFGDVERYSMEEIIENRKAWFDKLPRRGNAPCFKCEYGIEI